MALAYDIGQTLPFLRAEAEGRMTQTWRIGTLTEGSDPDTFDVAAEFDVVYDGPGRLKSVAATSVSEAEPGAQFVAVQTLELHLPVGTEGIDVDMRALCTACPEDAAQIGRVVRIKGRPTTGQVTAARFTVEATGEQIVEGS